jgi:phage terminase large subunit-like protein
VGRTKELIRLEPWQVFIIASVFGWLKKKDGLRRFRILFLVVPRKNGKSAIAAGIGLYMLAPTASSAPRSIRARRTRSRRGRCSALPG